jgi:heat shock protein HslJ
MSSSAKLLGLAVVLWVIFAACDREKKPAQAAAPAGPVTLTGTEWSLEDLAGKGVIANARATLTFPEAGKVAGNGSCNRFTGTAEINGSAIKLGPLASTRMACVGEASTQETEYLTALEGAQRFEVKDGKLHLHVSGLDKPLVFHSAE